MYEVCKMDSKYYITQKLSNNGTISYSVVYKFNEKDVVENLLINKFQRDIMLENIIFKNCVFSGLDRISKNLLKIVKCINCLHY